ncbi:MAG: HEAT repeat domain-containing protein [Candidatus Aminicenantes bacterium]|nr:HEAT repeat domain-containing protein [Candidatus Aminicenantes bacterium]
MRRYCTLLFISLLLIPVLYAQKVDIYKRPEHFERSRDYDVLHYKLKFRFDEENKTYWGENTITLMPFKDDFQKCVLDAVDFIVTSVTGQDGISLKFERTDKHLIVYLSRGYSYKEKLFFVVKYFKKKPKTGLRFIEATPDNPAQITSFSWPEKARYWFPCYDFPNDKVTNELIATVKSSYKVISNGRLIGVTEDEKNNTQTYHWSQELPHSAYLIMMAAGPYEIIEDSLGDLPVNYWVYKKDVPNALRSFRKTPKMIEFYNKIFGFKYPWAKYDQVCTASGGGIENTSATGLGHGTIHDERAEQDFSSDGLVSHELAHQWWGNTITERTWSHVWLSESFATYSEYLFTQYDRGEDEGAVNLLRKKNRYLNEARNRYIRPLVFNRYNNPWNIMDSHSYPKGATILHMLRFVMGDKSFFRSLQHFLKKHAFQVVDTHDLEIAIKEASGQNLDWFFKQWIFKPGHPVFDINQIWDKNSKKLTLKIIQTQDTSKGIPIYKTPVLIGIMTPGKKLIKKIWIKDKESVFEFEVEQKPLLVRFDEGNFLLKEWTFNKTLEDLLYQLKNDDVIGRMWTASELIKFKSDNKTATALLESAKNDPFWNVRANAVNALEKLQRIEDPQFFKEKCNDKNSKVRTAAVRILGNYKNPKNVKFLKDLFKKENSYLVQAEILRAIGKLRDKSHVTFLEKAAQVKSPRNIIKRAANRAIEEIKNIR